MARLQENGMIKYGKGELQSTPSFGERDGGCGGLGMLDPSDPAQSLGFLPGQTLSKRLFPDPLAREPEMTMEIVRRIQSGRKDL